MSNFRSPKFLDLRYKHNVVQSKLARTALLAFLVAGVYVGVANGTARSQAALQSPPPGVDAAAPAERGDYVVLSWNDLGMHCYNADFQDLAVLPPFNTLWAQVVRVDDPPVIVTQGISVTYEFPDNTYSVGKSNFWDHDQDLFGVDLPPNVGLMGKGMSGEMDLHGDHFVAEGIPLTEYRDSDLVTPYPYQLAEVVARDAGTGAELARSTVVAPVSSEMHCDNCHFDGNLEDIATGRVETNVLTLHDRENSDEYPPGHDTPLMQRRPVLCAECHASNALNAPGLAGIPNLSRAIHAKHQDKVMQNLQGCYACHPGPQTQCLRDTMYQAGMDCVDCHGTMEAVAANPNPWLAEPRCDNAACHGSAYQQDQPLYRMSKEHGGIYCAACHDSPHAIAPSREANDRIKFIQWQGHAGTLDSCTVCHSAPRLGGGPHNISGVVQRQFSFEPDRASARDPGQQMVYLHTLHNTGNISDTYHVSWSSSNNWSAAPGMTIGGSPATPPLNLTPGQEALFSMTVTVPAEAVLGTMDKTVITVTSQVSPTLVQRVVDWTLVPNQNVYLPIVMQD